MKQLGIGDNSAALTRASSVKVMHFSGGCASFPEGVGFPRDGDAPLSDAKLYRRGRIDLELMAADWQDGERGANRDSERDTGREGRGDRSLPTPPKLPISFLFRYLKAESNYPLTFGTLSRRADPLARMLRRNYGVSHSDRSDGLNFVFSCFFARSNYRHF